MKTLFAFVLAAALLPTFARAAEPQVPPPDCHEPTPPPAKGATVAQVDSYNKALPKYRDCIQKYVTARTNDAKKYSTLAQANAKAATDAVNQFNALVKSVSGSN